MNGYLRNPEIRRELVLYAALAAAAALAGFAAGEAAGFAAIAAAIIYTALHFISSYRRYSRIAELSRELDALLHGAERLDLAACGEGELAILASELAKLVIRLRESAALLQEDKIQLNRLIADISHQLRTPLTSLNLTVTLLSEPDCGGERQTELIARLRGGLSRISWLIEALLRLSRLDAGMTKLSAKRVELAELVKKAASPLEIALDIRGVALRVNVAGGFTGDLEWTSEALGNLIKNALEHSPEGGEILIDGAETPIYTELRVRDCGAGFSSADLPHIFERFYRGSNASEGSFGIGLALARAIVAAQNGTIKAENRPEGGAEFTIKLYKGAI